MGGLSAPGVASNEELFLPLIPILNLGIKRKKRKRKRGWGARGVLHES